MSNRQMEVRTDKVIFNVRLVRAMKERHKVTNREIGELFNRSTNWMINNENKGYICLSRLHMTPEQFMEKLKELYKLLGVTSIDARVLHNVSAKEAQDKFVEVFGYDTLDISAKDSIDREIALYEEREVMAKPKKALPRICKNCAYRKGTFCMIPMSCMKVRNVKDDNKIYWNSHIDVYKRLMGWDNQ